MKIIKSFLIIILSVIMLFCAFLLFDMADYDNSYVNRKSLVIDVKNLNSRHSHRTIFFLRKNFINLASKISRSYKKRWDVESAEERSKLPEYKIIQKKTKNFAKSLNVSDDYINYSNWPRSHGNNYASRFSGLKKINKENIKNLKVAWKYKSNDSIGKEIQANAVVVNGLIYTPTPGNFIVCLDGKTGNEIWKFKVTKGVAARRGLVLWKNPNENFSRIFFTNNEDKLIALNSKTGKKIKSFGNKGEINIGLSPIPPLVINNYLIVATYKPDLQVYDVVSGKLFWKFYLKESKNNFLFENFKNGNPWGGISADNKRGIVYITTGNPAPWYVGVDRPGDNLYANSIIAIDIKNKKKLWHFQEISHDIWNMDLAAPPILSTIKKNNIYIDVVIIVTKLGNTFIFDRISGETIFDIIKKRAPTSKVPGERTALYQPDIKLPQPICRNQFKNEYITNIGKKNYDYLSSIVDKANFGFPIPFEIGKKSIQIGGCVRWAGASVNPKNGIMFVSADQIPYTYELVENERGKFSYYSLWEPFFDQEGFPGIKPPWGTLTALNLINGKIIWQVPLGEYENLTKRNISITGTLNRSGATATAGGLVFVSGTQDRKIRAFDALNGKELWSHKMSFIGSAPPTSYMIDEKQYIIIPTFEKDGDELIAFSIK